MVVLTAVDASTSASLSFMFTSLVDVFNWGLLFARMDKFVGVVLAVLVAPAAVIVLFGLASRIIQKQSVLFLFK